MGSVSTILCMGDSSGGARHDLVGDVTETGEDMINIVSYVTVVT